MRVGKICINTIQISWYITRLLGSLSNTYSVNIICFGRLFLWYVKTVWTQIHGLEMLPPLLHCAGLYWTWFFFYVFFLLLILFQRCRDKLTHTDLVIMFINMWPPRWCNEIASGLAAGSIPSQVIPNALKLVSMALRVARLALRPTFVRINKPVILISYQRNSVI